MPGVPEPATIKQLKDLHKQGRYLDAWELIRDLDPPEEWPEVGHRLQGARLLDRLGAGERGRRMVLREWRRKETRHLAREDALWEVLKMRGALLTWQWLEKHPPDPREDEENHRDHHGFRAYLLTKLRDFQRAEASLAEGFKLDPESHWLRVLRADLHEAQDQRMEALGQLEEALARAPTYISGIASRAEILADLQRDEEAVAVLQSALTQVQSGQLASQLANLLIELGRLEEAEAALDLFERVTPLREPQGEDWLRARRCALASHRGDHEAALLWASRVQKDGFYRRVEEKLKAAQGELRRKVLPVAFVRQHDVTCAPATVTSLAQYWGHDVVHLELAEEICYDGTPDYRERNWAEKNGWATREFRVTVEAAKQLIDAGMPFVLNTVYPGGAHAQAVIGYDEFRTVLFIRNPGNRHTTEFLAEEALKEQEPFGPRGFVMVPAPEAARLAELNLPDSEVYDLTHQISSALDRHDRTLAAAALETLRQDWPNHLLRIHGELMMARYDGNHSQALRCLEELLSVYPDVVNWQMEAMSMIREVRGREALLTALRNICAKKDSHALLWRMLARELQSDDRNSDEVARWLRRVHRCRVDAQAVTVQANLRWTRREWPEATELYRLASCLDSRKEGPAMTYFNAAILTGQAEAAISLLRRRYEDEGDLSGQPACTLARALERMSRAVESLKILEESLRRRPEDADHAMYVAGEMASWGRVEQARAILEQTPKSARAAGWHRVQARLALREGNSALQLEHRRAVVADQPLDWEEHGAIAALLEQQEGVGAAIAYLRGVCDRFPFHWSLHVSLLNWLRPQSPVEWEKGVRELLRIDPDDAWAHRELADALCAAKRFAEAHRELDIAAALEPRSAALYAVRGSVYEDEDKPAEARAACHRAVELDVDSTFAQRMLIRLCPSQAERLTGLRYIQQELKRQTTNGDGVLEFAAIARRYLDPQELLQFLREGRAARPDLWQTGVTLMEQLRHVGLKDESTTLARSLTEQFPLLPRMWMELGLSLEAQGRRQEAIDAAEKVRELSPGWARGMETVYSLKRKAGDYAGAKVVLEQGLRHSPQDSTLHGCLADLLWHGGEKAAALEHLKKAVEIEPGYSWAWEKLPLWGAVAGQPNAAREAVERVLRDRPAEARSWMIQADSLTQSSELEARLEALAKAIACAPGSWGPVDEKARVLALAGRFDAALQLCRNHGNGAVQLRVRAAWILNYKGNYAEAVKAMDAVLVDDPGQIWGWQLLVEWHQKHDQLNLAEAALEQLIRLQPEESTHLGSLAEIQLSRLKKDEAKRTLERALRVAPDYRFALQKLFWIHIEEGDFEMAEKVVNDARPHLTNIDFLSRAFILGCRRKHWTVAWTTLDAILRDPEDDENVSIRVQNEVGLVSGKLRRDAEACIVNALRTSKPNVNAGRLYVASCEIADKLPKKDILRLVPADSEAGTRMHVRYLSHLARRWTANHKTIEGFIGLREWWRLRQLMKQHREWLRKEPRLYGSVSYILHTMNRTKETIDWLSDWRDRDDLEPYMLNNLLLCLQAKGRKDEAAAVVARGMILAEHNETKMRFHIWAAIEHALNNDEASASVCLDAVNRGELDSFGKELMDFAEVLMWYQPEKPNPPPFASVETRLRAFINSNRKNSLMRLAARRGCALAAKRLRSIRPRIWYVSETWGPKSLGVFAGVVLATQLFRASKGLFGPY